MSSSAAVCYLGRNQGPEPFFDQPFTAASKVIIPQSLNLNRPLSNLVFRFRGRVVIGVANYTAVAAEAPMTILDRIRVYGVFRGSALTPIDLSGATAFAMGYCTDPDGNSLYIGSAPPVLQAAPGVPFAQLGAIFGNVGTYDLDIWYRVPMAPTYRSSIRALSDAPYWWYPEDWNQIQIELTFGDATSFGTPAGGTTTTFTAFGSGAGSPTVSIYPTYNINGPLRQGFRHACVIRNEIQVTAGLAAVSNNVLVRQLDKQKTTGVYVKTGLVLAGTSAFAHVFGTLDDAILDVTQLQVDNRAIRNNPSNLATKEHANRQFGAKAPQGYLLFPFIDTGSPRSAYRADLSQVVAPTSSFNLMSNVISANAQNAANVIQEEIYAQVDDPYWAGTK